VDAVNQALNRKTGRTTGVSIGSARDGAGRDRTDRARDGVHPGDDSVEHAAAGMSDRVGGFYEAPDA